MGKFRITQAFHEFSIKIVKTEYGNIIIGVGNH
jgi:hypothetical protein